MESIKWEYELLLVDLLTTSQIYEHLKVLGSQGWELVSVDKWHAYFKRPLKK